MERACECERQRAREDGEGSGGGVGGIKLNRGAGYRERRAGKGERDVKLRYERCIREELFSKQYAVNSFL